MAERLFARDKVALISGSLFSHVGLALTAYAKQSRQLTSRREPLADALVWAQGNRYTFRLRPSTYMQAAMLAAEVAKVEDAKRWATIAPNYAYGKDAVAAFRRVLTRLRPDVEFVGSQWPALFKIDAGAEVEALKRVEPDAIYNVTFGGDLAKFVREGKLRGLFEGRLMVGLLTGEPEYIDPLKDEAPEGWLVTGYPGTTSRLRRTPRSWPPTRSAGTTIRGSARSSATTRCWPSRRCSSGPARPTRRRWSTPWKG